jgi:hypothetical protein
MVSRGLVAGFCLLTAVGGCKSRAAEPGTESGPCYGNGTCNEGLRCQGNACVRFADGAANGACYGNGTCNPGLACVNGICVAVAAPAAGGVVEAAASAVGAAISAVLAPLAADGGESGADGSMAPIHAVIMGQDGGHLTLTTLGTGDGGLVDAPADGGKRFLLIPATLPARKK